MNVNLVKTIDENYAIVDENGNITVVSLDSDSIFENRNTIEEILMKENQIEHLNKELNKCKNEQKENKSFMILAEIVNFGVYALMYILFLAMNSVCSIQTTIFATIFFLISSKILTITIFDTRINRFKERKKIKDKLEKIKAEIPSLNQSINELKKNLNYKKVFKVKALTSNQAINSIRYRFDNTDINEDSNENKHIDSVGFQFSKKKKF